MGAIRRCLAAWAGVVLGAGVLAAAGGSPPPLPVTTFGAPARDVVARANDPRPSSLPPPASTTVVEPSTTVTSSPPVTSPSTSSVQLDDAPGTYTEPEVCIPGTLIIGPFGPEGCQFKPSWLAGTVRNHLGSPVANICIGPTVPGAAWARSDASGQWAGDVAGVNDQHAQIYDCGDNGELGWMPQRAVPIDFLPGDTTVVDAVVTSLAGIEGTVVDAEGRPVAGACVASGGRQDQPPVGPTGGDGRFRMTGVEPGSFQLNAGPCPGETFSTIGHFDPPVVTTTAGRWTSATLTVTIGAGLGADPAEDCGGLRRRAGPPRPR